MPLAEIWQAPVTYHGICMFGLQDRDSEENSGLHHGAEGSPGNVALSGASTYNRKRPHGDGIVLVDSEAVTMGWQDHRPRDEARAIIFDVVAESERPLTRTEIARAIQRVKTPHLISMIEELVEEGILRRWTTLYPNGVGAYVYTLADS